MAESSGRLRNTILSLLALACLVYAAQAIWKTSKVPPASNANQLGIICTSCWQESVMTVAESEAAEDEETGLLTCPKCGEAAASTISLRCPECKRAIPRSMVVFGTEYVCPFCKAPLGTNQKPPPQP
jgi:hypothetical protein